MQAIQLGPTPVDVAIDRAQLVPARERGRPAAHRLDPQLAGGVARHAWRVRRRARTVGAGTERSGTSSEWQLSRALRAIDASTIELLAGDAEAAERELRTGYGMLEEIGDMHLRPTVAAYLAAVLAQGGRFTDAEEFARFARVTRLGGRHRHAGDVAGGPGPGSGRCRRRRRGGAFGARSGRAGGADRLPRPAGDGAGRARSSPPGGRLTGGRGRRPPRRRRSTSARGTSSARSRRRRCSSRQRVRRRSRVSRERRFA